MKKKNEFALQHPFTGIIVGPTGCGKSQLTNQILSNCRQTIDPCPEKILFCYAESQPGLYSDIIENMSRSCPEIELNFCKGLPNWNQVFPFRTNMPPALVVIDDLMTESGQKKQQRSNHQRGKTTTSETSSPPSIVDLFTRGSHHRNLSVLFLCQNLFYRGGGNYMRDITLNSHYIFAFKNPRDRTQITHLIRQMAPDDWRRVHEQYEKATARPYQYFLFDLKQTTDDPLRCRTDFIWSARNGCAVIVGSGDHHETERLLNQRSS